MARNLDELKEELYEAFNASVANAKRPYLGNAEGLHAASAAYKSAADIARSIISVEQELAVRDEKKSGMKMPGKL